MYLHYDLPLWWLASLCQLLTEHHPACMPGEHVHECLCTGSLGALEALASGQSTYTTTTTTGI